MGMAIDVFLGLQSNHLSTISQLADSMGSEKACKILGDLLAGGLFESDSAAEVPYYLLSRYGPDCEVRGR
jgi:hypothetical protein